MNKWISVEDGLPYEVEEVFVRCKNDSNIMIAHHDGEAWYEKCDNLDTEEGAWRSTKINKLCDKNYPWSISHWMVIPLFPELED